MAEVNTNPPEDQLDPIEGAFVEGAYKLAQIAKTQAMEAQQGAPDRPCAFLEGKKTNKGPTSP